MRLLLIATLSLLVSCDACDQLANKFRRDDTPTLPNAQAALIDYRGELADAAGGQIMAGFDVVVEAGSRLEIVVESDAFDPVLIVTPPGSQPIQNDDWQGSRSVARLDLDISTPGTMKVGVSSFAPGARGAYHLIARRVHAASGSATVTNLVAGVTDGELGPQDERLPDGRFVERFRVSAPETGSLELQVEGREGPAPSAVVTAADGSFIESRNGSAFLLTGSGPHHVQLVGPAPNASALYRLTVRPTAGSNTPTPARRSHHALPEAASGEPITSGETRSGALAEPDPRLPTGESYDLLLFTAAEANSPLSINLSSSEFDPYLLVIGPNGQVWEDDDSGDGIGSHLVLRPPSAGEYRIVVTSYRSDERGDYSLKIMESDEELDGGSAPAPPTQAAPQAGSSLRRAGALQSGDSQLQTGEFVDRYPVSWTVGQQVSIRLNSTEFDPYLILRMPDGQQIDNDDLSDNDLQNSGLDHTVTSDGQHTVLVTSYRPGESGSYTLEISGDGDNSGTPAPAPVRVDGDATRGSLEPSDPVRPSGEFYDEHLFNWNAGQNIDLRLTSSAFDTYLIVRPPSGDALENDDAVPGQTDAALRFVAPLTGQYSVIATSYRSGMQGEYSLLLNTAGGAATPPPTETPTPSSGRSEQPADVRAPIAGELREGDGRLDSGEYRDVHQISLAPGSARQLLLSSSDFDPYLILRTPSGQQLDNDDLTPATRNAGIDIPVAEAGNYQATVTSYRPGETGRYELSFAAGQPIARPGATTGGRVFGVFAGISDYPAGVGDLPECANDALKLAETLRNSGLLTEDRQIVLTDARASTANIRDAMRQMSQRVGPDDVFIFFFSGHGGQTGSSSDSRELDGRDEFLVMHDGQILDDEVGRLLDGLTPRLSVVAIDSCHSGGLAKDVITRPGRIGLFSSEEDVLSAVASQFQAGGYLSHFLRTGMGGAADTEPQDGVLTVGELTHFLYTQFGAHAQDVHRAASYQHLVMDRGAVRVDHVMWSYR